MAKRSQTTAAIVFSNQSDSMMDYFVLSVPKEMLTSTYDLHRSSLLGHEFGHAILGASILSRMNAKHANEPCKQLETTENFLDNWQTEIDADKISMVANFENNMGRSFNFLGNTKSRLNEVYQKGFLPNPVAQVLAKFCTERDKILVPIIQRCATRFGIGPAEKICLLLSKLNINLSMTHPVALIRAVESDNFQNKARNYLVNNPS